MSQRTYFNALILLVILINSEAISLSEKIKQGRADIPTKQSDLHKINDEILFLETSAETKTMSTAELYTAELAQITEILKLGFGQIDHSLAKHVKKLRTVADGKILSREELHDHRKDIIAFVQKASKRMDARVHKAEQKVNAMKQRVQQPGSTSLVLKHFLASLFGFLDGVFTGKFLWEQYNGEQNEICKVFDMESLQGGKTCVDDPQADHSCLEKKLRDNFFEIIESIQDILTNKDDAVKDGKKLQNGKDSLSLIEIRQEWGIIGDAINSVADTVSETFVEVAEVIYEEVVEPVAETVVEAVEDTVDFVKTLPEKAVEAYKKVEEVIVAAAEDVVDAAKDIAEAAGDVLEAGWEMVKAGWEWVKKQLFHWVTKIVRLFKALYNFLDALGENLIDFVKRKAQGTCQLLSELVAAVPMAITAIKLKKIAIASSQAIPIVGQVVSAIKIILSIVTAIFHIDAFLESGEIVEDYQKQIASSNYDCQYFGNRPCRSSCEKGIAWNRASQIGLVIDIALNSQLVMKGVRTVAAKAKMLKNAVGKLGYFKGLRKTFKLRKYDPSKTVLSFPEWKKAIHTLENFAWPRWKMTKTERFINKIFHGKRFHKMHTLIEKIHLTLTGTKLVTEGVAKLYGKLVSAFEEEDYIDQSAKLTKTEKKKMVKANQMCYIKTEDSKKNKINAKLKSNNLRTSDVKPHEVESVDEPVKLDLCVPKCPSATNLHECFHNDFSYYQKKISLSYKLKNDRSANANTIILNKWKQCPSAPIGKVPCVGKVAGTCIDVRHEKCLGRPIPGNKHCPYGTHKHIHCCPDYMFERGVPEELLDECEEPVTIFKKNNFKGHSKDLVAGEYESLKHKSILSITVPNGCVVDLFNDESFQGSKITIVNGEYRKLHNEDNAKNIYGSIKVRDNKSKVRRKRVNNAHLSLTEG